MKVCELYTFLDNRIPRALSCEWDNDGMMCCPDGERAVKKVLVTLDITENAVDYAVKGGFDLILSHHPMIFKGVKAINECSLAPRKAIKLIKNNISAFSFHTRLDALDGGVNDCLAQTLGLVDVSKFGECDIGRVGYIPETDLLSFAKIVKSVLGAEGILVADAGKTVHKVALLGGEGDDDIAAAIATGADTYVSGRLGYHNMADAPDGEINLIEAGHFYTENPVCERLSALVKEADPTVECEIYFSNRIKLI